VQATGARLLGHGLEVDAVEQIVERALLDLDDGITLARGLGDAERAAIQTLVEQAQPGVVGEEDLHRVTTSAEEDEQRPATYLAAQSIGDER
jgi:hypothetical protein